MKRVLLVAFAALVLAGAGCVIEVIEAGDSCSDMSDQVCTNDLTALYCDGTQWVARNCNAECQAYGYTGGSCEWGNYRDECVCSGVVYTTWTPTGACNYNGDAYCWDRETMYYCTANTIYSYDCTTFCYDYYQSYPLDAFCMYNATRQCPGGGGNCPDDNCYCVY